MIHSTEIARKLLEKNVLNDPTFTIQDLFKIRDYCLGLAKYGLCDQDLLDEVLQFIKEKVGE